MNRENMLLELAFYVEGREQIFLNVHNILVQSVEDI